MSCHEIAALRLGLMKLLGDEDEAERAHELAELGAAAEQPGPLSSMVHAENLGALSRLFSVSLVTLNEKVSRTPASDPKQAYLRSLLILTKKVELELQAHLDDLGRLNRDLEEIHTLVHEIYPAS